MYYGQVAIGPFGGKHLNEDLSGQMLHVYSGMSGFKLFAIIIQDWQGLRTFVYAHYTCN
jgi:hypothetical protein